MQEMQETLVQLLGGEDPLEEEMATHSSILAWRIPWTEEPDRLQSIGSQSQTQLKLLTMHYHTVPGTLLFHSKRYLWILITLFAWIN